MGKQIIIISVLVCCFWGIKPTNAKVLFKDTFEYDTLDTNLATSSGNAQSGTLILGGGTNQIKVKDIYLYNGNKVVELVRTSNSSISSVLYCNSDTSIATITPPSDVVYKASIYRETSAEAGQFYITFGSGAIKAGWAVMTDQGKTTYSLYDGGSWVHTSNQASVGDWDTLELRLHLLGTDANNTNMHGVYDVYLTQGKDGFRTRIAQNLEIEDASYNNGTKVTLSMSWVDSATGTGQTYWDDISIEKLPSSDKIQTFSDDIEGHSLGSITTTSNIPIGYQWYDSWATNALDIVSSPTHTGVRSLKLTRNYPGGGQFPTFYAIGDSNSALAGYDSIGTFNVYRTDPTDGPEFYIECGGGTMGGCYVSNYSPYHWYVRNGTTWVDTGLASNTATWENVKIVAHFRKVGASGKIGGIYDVYITAPGGDSTKIASGFDLVATTQDSKARLHLYNKAQVNANTPNVTYWDDIRIEQKETDNINNAQVSWGDNAWVNGPGTDPALDSEIAIKNTMERWEGRGYTGCLWRTDLMQQDPNQVVYMETNISPTLMIATIRVEELDYKINSLATALSSAENQDLDLWVFHPTVYSDGTAESEAWSYVLKYAYDHNEIITTDPNGNKQWGVREYAYAGARSSKIDEFEYLVNTFGVKDIVVSMRTEACEYQDPPRMADQFGFNQNIVDEMLNLHNVNILTDSRFDFDDPDFDPCDTMVENWHALRGSYLTQFFSELRTAMDAIDPSIRISTQIPGDHVGPPLGNWKLDWRKWVDEGLIDEITVPIHFEGTADPCSGSKKYLTDLKNGVGYLNIETVYRAYIQDSNHPEISIINGGQYEGFPLPDVTGSDGWQTFWAGEAYDLAWYQRWEQWKNDIKDFGYIKFIEQNFDGFSVHTKGILDSGGEGDPRYDPNIRACEGAWWPISDGNDSTKATVQNTITHGASGNAMKLPIYSSLSVYHMGGIDHSTFQSYLDNIISNGTCSFEFWVYRNPNSSFMANIIWSSEVQRKVGLNIEPNGVVKYNNGTDVNDWQGNWTTSGYTLSADTWQKFTIDVNLTNKTYSAYAGSNKSITLCSNVNYYINTNRFNYLTLSTQGTQNYVYIDDVSVKWYPALHYESEKNNVYFADNFESHTTTETIDEGFPELGRSWAVSSSTDDSKFFITNRLSWGDGFKSLVATHTSSGTYLTNNQSNKLTLTSGNAVTVDFDVYLKSNYKTVVGIFETSSIKTAVLKADTAWKYWNGSSYVTTGTNVTYNLWNHVQLILDCSNKTYTVIVQPCGSMPILLGTYNWDSGTSTGDNAFFGIFPDGNTNEDSYYDNIKITYGN